MNMNGMKRVSMIAIVVVLLAGSVSSWRPVAAQTGPGDILPALLVEVKGLRAAMEQMAAGSTQAQLLVGRLQLQEGRITSMVRRLDTVRDNLATARREHDQIAGSVQALQSDSTPGGIPEGDKDAMLKGLKLNVAAAKANVDRLAAEELQLTGDIAAEQQRWVTINQRLDELERALATPKR
jgi:hypothetical protein